MSACRMAPGAGAAAGRAHPSGHPAQVEAVFGGLGWFWVVWLVLGVFGCFWVVLGGFGWFWVVLGGFGWFWVVLGGFGWFWVVLGGFGFKFRVWGLGFRVCWGYECRILPMV